MIGASIRFYMLPYAVNITKIGFSTNSIVYAVSPQI